MSFRTTYILFALLGVVVIVFAVALFVAPSGKVDDTFVLPSANSAVDKVEARDIVKVEVERKDADVHLVFEVENPEAKKDDRKFRLIEPSGYRVRSDTAYSIASQVLAAKTAKGDLTDKLKDWGLERPKGSIKLTTDKGRELTVNLGDLKGNRLYVTSSDKPKTPMVVEKSALSAAFTPLADMRATDFVSARADDIKWLRVVNPAKKDAESVTLLSQDGKWRYEQPKYGAADYDGSSETDAKGLSGVRALVTALTSLAADGRAAEKKDKDPTKLLEPSTAKTPKERGFWEDNARDLKQYGLEGESDASLVLEAKTDPDAKSGQTILIGKEVKEVTKDAKDADWFFARLDGEKHVVTVTKKSLETFRELLNNREAVRDRDLVRLTDKPDVIRIQYDSKNSIDLFRTASSDPHGPHGGMGGFEIWKFYRDAEKTGEKTDSESVKRLIDALVSNKRQVKEFPDPSDAALGLKDSKDNLTISLWVNGIKKASKKDDKDKKDDDKDKKDKDDRPELANDKPDVVLVFGKVDAKKLVAIERRSGKDLKQVDVVKTLDSVYEIARGDAMSYLDKGLPQFFAMGEGKKPIKALTVEFDGKTTVAEKKKPEEAGSDWELKKPTEWEGRKAAGGTISSITLSLNGMTVERWETLKAASDAQLGNWGLKTPAGKVTLTLKDGDKTSDVSLLIGRLTDDKSGYYAKKSDYDRVFVLKKSDVDRMKEPLLNMQVLDFSSTEVRGIKFTGWPQLGKPLTLELTRDGERGPWKGDKDLPRDVKIQNDQIDKLLEAMVSLNAKRFVVFKSGAKEEHGLEPSKSGLAIEVTLETKDKKTEKFTLSIGTEDKDKDGFYATSSKQAGDVFTIGKGQEDIFLKAKESVKTFAK